VLDDMPNFVENRHGTWWVPNPAHEDENFADKWNEYPQRRIKFFSWLADITGVLDDVMRMEGKGLPRITARLSESFGAGPIQLATERYSNQLREQRRTGDLYVTSTGLLTTTAGVKIPDHAFHGDHTDPRG
jgi:hypothetical protein